MTGINSLFGMNFDYRAQQAQLKAALAAEKKATSASTTGTAASENVVKTLKKESAAFLDSYIADMKGLKTSSDALSSGKAAAMLKGEEGSDKAKNVEKTVEAAQKMVDAYNKALANVTKNSDRGTAVTRQQERLDRPLASDRSLDLVGMKKNEDGSISLDKKKLTEALSGDKAALTTDLLGTIAGTVKRSADNALIQSPQSLINNDLAAMKQAQAAQSPVRQQADNSAYAAMSLYSKSGAYNMMNMGTIGFLMNTLA